MQTDHQSSILKLPLVLLKEFKFLPIMTLWLLTALFCGMCTQSYKPRKASPEDLIEFHAEDYIKFLQNITPDNQVWTAYESSAISHRHA